MWHAESERDSYWYVSEEDAMGWGAERSNGDPESRAVYAAESVLHGLENEDAQQEISPQEPTPQEPIHHVRKGVEKQKAQRLKSTKSQDPRRHVRRKEQRRVLREISLEISRRQQFGLEQRALTSYPAYHEACSFIITMATPHAAAADVASRIAAAVRREFTQCPSITISSSPSYVVL